MANRWETMETVRDFVFLGSKLTTDGDCSHEIKRHLLLGIKAMTNLIQFSSVQLLSRVQLLHPYMTTENTIALTRQTFVVK